MQADRGYDMGTIVVRISREIDSYRLNSESVISPNSSGRQFEAHARKETFKKCCIVLNEKTENLILISIVLILDNREL